MLKKHIFKGVLITQKKDVENSVDKVIALDSISAFSRRTFVLKLYTRYAERNTQTEN